MKTCPTCNRTFDDSLNFCTFDGTPLKSSTEKTSGQPDQQTGGQSNQQPSGQPTQQTSGQSDQQSVGQPVQQPQKRKRSVGRVILIIVAVVVALFVALCIYVYKATTYIRTDEVSLRFGKTSVEPQRVLVDHDGYYFVVDDSPDWCVVSQEDNAIMVICKPNETDVERRGDIVLSSGKAKCIVTVTQTGAATYISLDPTYLLFDSDGGSARVTVVSDGADFHAEFPRWCTLRESDNTVIITAENNSTGSHRSGYITLSSGMVSATLVVEQVGLCTFCQGTGTMSCLNCGGSGQVLEFTMYGSYYSPCLFCLNGKVPCTMCNGQGKI